MTEINGNHVDGMSYEVYLDNESLFNLLSQIKSNPKMFKKAFKGNPSKRNASDIVLRVNRSYNILYKCVPYNDGISKTIDKFVNALLSPKHNYIYYYETSVIMEI
uniref:Uncharacterized protein n=1 Tax=Strongyloides stercoralis TaxID=6248 RepID=A0AAF5DJC1_STRER